MKRRTGVLLAVGAVVVLGVGYGAADAADLVPGPLTTAEPWPEAEPFPTPIVPGRGPVPEVLPPLSASAPVPDAEIIAAAAREMVQDEATGAGVGVVVVDLATGEELVAIDATQRRTPASATKILTGLAAVTSLDLDDRLTTSALLSGDDLYLVGGGDMTLAADEGDPTAVLGRAGLADLARETAAELQQRGVDSVTLRLDDSLFTGASESPGWGYWGVGDGFVAPIEAVAVDLGEVEGQVATSLRPAVDAAVIFRDALREAGVTVEDGLERDEAPQDATTIAQVSSATLRELLAVMMTQSDNTLAEVFGRLVAIARGEAADFEGATTAVLAGTAAAGVDVSGTVLSDTSGLNSANAIAPELLIDVLVAANEDPALTELARVLPVSGLVGTLAERDIPPGAVRGKTGTLEDVVSLAGYVTTADGRPLAFAVMADDVEYGGIWAARERIDAYLTQLSACGCQPESDV